MGKKFEVAFAMSGQVAASFKRTMTDAGAALDALNVKAKALEKGQGDISRFRALKAEVKTTAEQFSAAQDKARQLAQAMAQVENPTKAMQREFAQAVKQAGALKDRLAAKREELQRVRGALSSAGIATTDLVGKQKALAASAEQARKAQAALQGVMLKQQEVQNRRGQKRMELLDAYAMARTLAAPIQAAVEFETAMQGIARQVDGAKDSAGNFTPVYYEMGRQIQMLGRELPLATNEIADMVTAGARMNVPKNELISFTRLAAEMATAFEAPAGALSESMGKIANNFKIPIQNIRGLADSINYLDDNAISKGADIIGVLQRISGTVSSVKMSAQDAAALGSTLLTSGMTEETSGTAINAIVGRLAAAEKGTAKLKRAMGELGISTKAVQKGMQTDATGTILQVLDKISTMPADKRMGLMIDLVGREHAPTMAKLATNTDEFRRQLALANGEAAKGSMGREMAVRMKGAAAQTQIFKNIVTELGVNLGTVLLPGLNAVGGGLGSVIGGMATFAHNHQTLTAVLTGTTAALMALKIGSIGLGYAWTFVQGGALMAQRVFLTLRTGILAATLATNGLTAATGLWATVLAATPIGWVAAGVAGLAVAGLALWKYWEPISVFFQGFWSGLVEGLAPVASAFAPLAPIFSAVSSALATVFDWFMKLLEPMKLAADTFGKIFSSGAAIGKAVGGAVSWAAGKIGLGGGDSATLPSHGTGGTFSIPHAAIVGDRPETIVPHDRNANSLGLWASAGRALGVGGGGGGGISVTFAPQITMNGGGDGAAVGQALKESEGRLLGKLQSLMQQERRLALA